jgi:hypothetical protein
MGFLLLTSGWCLLFFSLSDCKLPTYILPAFPFLSLAFGAFLAHTRWQQSRLTWAGAACGFVFLLACHWAVVPWLARARSPMTSPEDIQALCSDPAVPVVCFPRPVDSVAFYVNRSDLRSYRSKETPLLLQHLQAKPRTVVLFGHRHSLEQLREVLPANLRMIKQSKLGLCDLAVVDRRPTAVAEAWVKIETSTAEK